MRFRTTTPQSKYVIDIDGESAENLTVKIDNMTYTANFAGGGNGNKYSLILDGKAYHVILERNGDHYFVKLKGRSYQFRVEDERARLIRRYLKTGTKKSGDYQLNAPIPGLITKVEVEEGARVKKGQGLVILEAMKMENELKSPIDGVVKTIKVKEGKPIEKGEIIMIFHRD